MSSVYLLRHCQTTGQEPDSSLSQKGFQQAEMLTEFLNQLSIKKVVSSPFKRAQQSVFPFLSKNQIKLTIDERLQERTLGKLETFPWQVMLENTFRNLDLKYPQGESSRQAMERGRKVVDLYLNTETTLLVTHGNLLALILKSFDPKIGFVQWRSLSYPDLFEIKVNPNESKFNFQKIMLPKIN